MMLMSSISDVEWRCCKCVENRVRFRSSKSRNGLAIMSGSAAALRAVPTEAPTFPSPNGPGRLLILRKLLYFSPVAQPATWDAYKRLSPPQARVVTY
jgi:hypothetical protein